MDIKEFNKFMDDLKILVLKHPIVADWFVEISDRNDTADTPQTEETCERCVYVRGSQWCQGCNGIPKRWDGEKIVDTPQTDIPKSTLRTDCTGCRFVGSYDTEFPCANCVRKNKDYYDAEQTDCEETE